jgi:hypothetical protein
MGPCFPLLIDENKKFKIKKAKCKITDQNLKFEVRIGFFAEGGIANKIQENVYMETVDKIDNLRLIENSLLHMQFELERESPSYFRLAREAHLLLYRTMIESLTGSNWQNVTGHRAKDRSVKYQWGDKPWQEIHKEVKIEGCHEAWRFSHPVVCAQPPEDRINEVFLKSVFRSLGEAWLIGFYDALAMIQTECFMHKFIYSKSIMISNEDMITFEWLHENIRNEYEHFIPKLYWAPVYDLLWAVERCLSVSKELLFESGNVIFHTVTKKSLKELLESVFKGATLLLRNSQQASKST